MGGTHVALIRGINIGRAKRVAMADLRIALHELGYRDVRTLLNSGNVVLTSGRKAPRQIAGEIERMMLDRLGVSARVVVLSRDEFTTAVQENTLAALASDPSRLVAAFCVDTDRLTQLEPLLQRDWGTNALAIGSVAAYVWCADGIVASELLEAVGRTLGKSMTARNWATVTKILAVLRSMPGAKDVGRRPTGGRT